MTKRDNLPAMPSPFRAKSFTYPPVDVCIYCGARNCRLTDEHIIPASLAGRLILPRATCDACQAITRAFTQTVSRSMYGRLRTRLNVFTRRPKDRPSHFPLTVRKDDGTQRTMQIPAALYPRAHRVMDLDEAGILTGTYPKTFRDVLNDHPEDITELYRRGYISADEAVEMEDTIFPYVFCQLLAQIAHANTVALIGFENYEAFLPPIILGKATNPFQYIGGVPADKQLNSAIAFDILERRHIYYVSCRFGMAAVGWRFPTYQIVCGVIPTTDALKRIATRLNKHQNGQ